MRAQPSLISLPPSEGLAHNAIALGIRYFKDEIFLNLSVNVHVCGGASGGQKTCGSLRAGGTAFVSRMMQVLVHKLVQSGKPS